MGTSSTAAKAVSAARRALVLDYPFYGVLALKLEVVEDPGVGTMSTDGRSLWYAPAFVSAQTKAKLMGTVAHEVLHCALGHQWRRGNRDPEIFNEAADYVVNPIVLEAGLELPDRALDGSPYKGMSVEAVYDRLISQAQQQAAAAEGKSEGNEDEPDCGQGSEESAQADNAEAEETSDGAAEDGDQGDDSGSDEQAGQDADASAPSPTGSSEDTEEALGAENAAGGEASPGDGVPGEDAQAKPATTEAATATGHGIGGILDAPEGEREMAKAEWSAAVATAAKQARGIGVMSPGLERLVQAVTNPPQDWRALLWCFVQPRHEDYAWSTPNARYLPHGLYMPALNAPGIGPMVVFVDTSGSIDEVLLGKFGAELNAIAAAVEPEMVTVVYCDAVVQRVDTYQAGEPIELQPVGFGGTDFRPMFEWVEENHTAPECAIMFTDMMGPFPEEAPEYPVLIANTGGDLGRQYFDQKWAEIIDL